MNEEVKNVLADNPEHNLSDFALFLAVMKKRRAYENLLSIVMDEMDLHLTDIKYTNLDNPEIVVKDKRIVELNQIVEEVKQSEEWEDARMSILKVGLEKGEEIGKAIGIQKGIQSTIEMCQECGGTRDMAVKKLQKNFSLSEEEAIKKVNLYWQNND